MDQRRNQNEKKKHLKIVKDYDLDLGPFEIGERDFIFSGQPQKGHFDSTKTKDLNQSGFSGTNEDDSWNKRKDHQDQTNFSGYGPRGYKRSDDRLYEDVCETLMKNRNVDASHISVKVSEGLVVLSGKVQSRKMKKLAESLIEDLPGVQDIRNELMIYKVASQMKSGPDSVIRNDLGIP